MTASVVSKVTIKSPPKVVFKYLSDSNYHFLWNPHLQLVSPMGPLKLGSEYDTTSLLLGTRVHGKNKVTKYKANEVFQIQNDAGVLKYLVNYNIQPKAETTVVTCTTKVTAEGQAFAFTTPILKLLARRELQSDLNALKIAAEHKLT